MPRSTNVVCSGACAEAACEGAMVRHQRLLVPRRSRVRRDGVDRNRPWLRPGLVVCRGMTAPTDWIDIIVRRWYGIFRGIISAGRGLKRRAHRRLGQLKNGLRRCTRRPGGARGERNRARTPCGRPLLRSTGSGGGIQLLTTPCRPVECRNETFLAGFCAGEVEIGSCPSGNPFAFAADGNANPA